VLLGGRGRASRRAKSWVIAGGVVGFNAAQIGGRPWRRCHDFSIAIPKVLEKLDSHFQGRARTIYSGKATLADLVADADLVIGAVLIPGAAAPKAGGRAPCCRRCRPGARAGRRGDRSGRLL